mmetsp:Transcript_23515/g.64870  ORF Transcript_23515/g.64870 Transcript_23515/m.64870 type:complete len:90 (-) Transcript_23515:31-300(-)
MIAGEAAALHRPRACTALTRDEVNASLTSRLASLLVTVHALFVHLFATLNDHLRSVVREGVGAEGDKAFLMVAAWGVLCLFAHEGSNKW